MFCGHNGIKVETKKKRERCLECLQYLDTKHHASKQSIGQKRKKIANQKVF